MHRPPAVTRTWKLVEAAAWLPAMSVAVAVSWLVPIASWWAGMWIDSQAVAAASIPEVASLAWQAISTVASMS